MWIDDMTDGIAVPMPRDKVLHIYERADFMKVLVENSRSHPNLNGDEVWQDTENRRIKHALEMIINGHLLIQKTFPNPDHPESSCKEVTVVFDSNQPIPVNVQRKIVEGYAAVGWELKFGQDWRSGGPWVICKYLEPDRKRKKNITTLVEEWGHRMSPWKPKQGGHTCKCLHPGCELEIFFRKNQQPNQWIYWCRHSPVQKALPCPCMEKDTF